MEQLLAQPTTKKSKYPKAVFELLRKTSGSGFIMEGTSGENRVEIVHPKTRVLINKSVVREESEIQKGVFVNVPTRYVYNQELIKVKDQEKALIKPNPKQDIIIFKNGILEVEKDGSGVGLYNFLTNHAQNESNPNRIQSLEPLFREIKPQEDAHEINLNNFYVAEAMMYVRGLMSEKAGSYIFQEERIDALCNHFELAGESYEAKIGELTKKAQQNPLNFLNEAKKTEQIAVIEVNHALHLKVIVFEKNTVMYVNKDEKIKTLTGNLSEENKVLALANWFKTADGQQAYELFKAELNAAKEANITQN